MNTMRLAAVPATHHKRQPARTLTGCNHLCERQHGPPVTRRAVRGKLVAMLMQSSNAS